VDHCQPGDEVVSLTGQVVALADLQVTCDHCNKRHKALIPLLSCLRLFCRLWWGCC
jgi:hypothetical protein